MGSSRGAQPPGPSSLLPAAAIPLTHGPPDRRGPGLRTPRSESRGLAVRPLRTPVASTLAPGGRRVGQQPSGRGRRSSRSKNSPAASDRAKFAKGPQGGRRSFFVGSLRSPLRSRACWRGQADHQLGPALVVHRGSEACPGAGALKLGKWRIRTDRSWRRRRRKPAVAGEHQLNQAFRDEVRDFTHPSRGQSL